MSWVCHHIQIVVRGMSHILSKPSVNKGELLSHPLTHLHGDLSNGPGGVITHRDKLRVQVEPQDGHELRCRAETDTFLTCNVQSSGKKLLSEQL